MPSRIVRNHMLDSTRWLAFRFRPGDIVTGTWAKSGTTWLQQIVGQLIFGGVDDLAVQDIGHWIDHRLLPADTMLAQLEAQTHRRFVKTHLPADAVPLAAEARYLYIGRDGRDVVWSWYNHHRHLKPRVLARINDTPGRVGPPLEPAIDDVRQYFIDWLERDGHPLWPFWSHVKSWWDVRQLPNVRLVHFDDLKRDLPGEIRRIAAFLDIEIDEDRFEPIVSRCTFDYMKAHASALSSGLDDAFEGGAATFMNRGTNGRWRDQLTAADIARYEQMAIDELGAECARWLATGAAP